MNRASYECETCKKTFTRPFALQRHIRLRHHEDHELYTCSECQISYKSKHGLLRHIQSRHSGIKFECKTCSKKFTRKEILNSHIFAKHGSSKSESLYECAHCGSKFENKTLLRCHIQQFHLIMNRTTPSYKISRSKCLLCGVTFPQKQVLNRHYEMQHKIVFNFDLFHFSSYEDFKEWLQKEEAQTLTHFIFYHNYTTKKGLVRRLICHRSKIYFKNPEVDDRKRSLKITGLKGLDGWCPSEILVTIADTGSCHVKFQRTHVGHCINDEAELKYMSLTEKQKLEIAGKIKLGVPCTSIWKQQLLSSNQNAEMDSSALLCSRDIRNIAAKYKIGFENRVPTNILSDPTDTETFVAANAEMIIFYKPQGEEDLTYEILQPNDFAVVIMSPTQGEYLRKYGEKLVAMEGTQDTNQCEFILHTLLVRDSEEEWVPVAFLISNRNDRRVINVFLTCLSNKIGRINTKCLITDMQLSYYYSWTEIMSPPEHFLYSTWHVREAWRKNYSKVSDKEKRKSVKRTVEDLAAETDVIEFERKLDSFITTQDPDLQSFLQYFLDFFAKIPWRWAYCHRLQVGINTNMNVEVFNRIFKHTIGRGQAIKTLSQCLESVRQSIALKEMEMRRKKIKGKVTSKLSLLRNRHRKALLAFRNGDQINVFPVCDFTFLVDSFNDTDSDPCQYSVSKKEFKACSNMDRACLLHCTSCNICFHEYMCTCPDSSIKNNMCQHIHYVGLWLKNNTVRDESPDDNMQIDIDTMNDDTVAEAVISSLSEDQLASANIPLDSEENIKTEPEEVEIISKENMIMKFSQILQEASVEELKFIYENFLIPLRSAVAVHRAVQLQSEFPEAENVRGKIMTHAHIFSTQTNETKTKRQIQGHSQFTLHF